jgi:hypothetical protein
MKTLFSGAFALLLLSTAHAGTVTNSNGTLSVTNPPNVVSVAWDDDGAVQYHVYWGSASRVYTNVLQVTTNFATISLGSKTSKTNTFYLAVTCSFTDPVNGLLESDFSSEVSFTPPTIQAPPTGVQKPIRLAIQQKLDALDFAWQDTPYSFDISPQTPGAFYRLQVSIPPQALAGAAQLRAIVLPPIPGQ